MGKRQCGNHELDTAHPYRNDRDLKLARSSGFLIFNALGGALWVLVWGFAGFYLGEHLSNVMTFARDLGMLGALVVAVVLLFVVLYAFRRAEK
jgi:membrane protein DedA with SNARE-associated domain